MELNKCNRCGNFHITENNVCPKCVIKENLEYNNFKNYIQENGLDNSINTMILETGLSETKLNNFLSLDDFKNMN